MGLIRLKKRSRKRWLALGLIFVGLAKGWAAEVDGVALMESYCLDCHDGETQKGEVNLEAALGAKPLVKNLDLWQRLDELAGRHQVEWIWVKGHSGHPGNERADLLANMAIDDLVKDNV